MTHKERTPEVTHKIMSAIKSKDTKPELLLRKALWKNKIRYRVNYKKLPGKPDIVITKNKIAIFCDGDFWHGHNWAIQRNDISSLMQQLIERMLSVGTWLAEENRTGRVIDRLAEAGDRFTVGLHIYLL